MHVRAGEKLTLIGPSGFGVTIVLRILMTLETLYAGHVVVNGDYLRQQRVGDGFVMYAAPDVAPALRSK